MKALRSTERFALTSRRVLTPGGVRSAAVVVHGERISAVLPAGEVPAGLAVHDLGDRVLFPGLVDSHVHLNDPGRSEWEGFEHGTRAAAAGGVTTLVDMPLNCRPVTTTAAAMAAKVASSHGRLWVECGLWGGVVPGNLEEIAPLAEAGVLGFKAFLIHSGNDDFPKVTAGDLRAAMPRLAEAGLPLLVHAELEDAAPRAIRGGPRGSYRRYLGSRPPAWENAAVELVIGLARESGCATHVVHLSSSSALPAIRRARDEGLPITVETCPHYLALTAEQVSVGSTSFKCAPPIREAENREGLWRGLVEGLIDGVVSDHSPCPPALKHLDTGDFERAWGGIASLQLGLSVVWTEARRLGLGFEDVGRWMCQAPARLAGLDRRKGRIAPGFDADLVAWDPEERFEVAASALHHRHRVTPYLGRALDGVVHTTWLRGRVVFDRERGFQGSPRGELLRGRGVSDSSNNRTRTSARGPT
jgi:allantoinase